MIIKKTKELKKYDDLLINYRRNEFSKELFIKIFSKDTLDYLDEKFSNIKTIVNNQNSNDNNEGIQNFENNNENNGNSNKDNSFNQLKNSEESLLLDDNELFCKFLFPDNPKETLFSYYILKKEKIFYETIKFTSNHIIYEDRRIKKIKSWLEETKKNNKVIINSKKLFEVLNDMKESFIKEFNDDIKIGLKFIFRKEKDKVGEAFYNISYKFCYITEKEIEEELNTNKTEEEKEANEVKKPNETNET